jgi:Asp-tRNA(Asn)/Glu-tRNA(Gln) amidotransferase A subunit family amidase
MLNETKKGPLFEPKFIFYKTDSWKLIDKKSRDAFEYFIKSFKKNIEIFDTPSYFKDIHKYHQIIHETDLANNFGMYYKKYKKKLSKFMQDAIIKGNKHSAKDYAEAIDFMKRSYDSYEEVFEDYHGVLTPSSPGVAPKGLKSTGTAEFNKVWSYLGTPCISLPLLQGENNMPLGVQLIGARYDDHRFLGVANWLEKECNK